MLTTLPTNVHVFFISHDADPGPMMADIQQKVEAALSQMNPLGACRWRHRIHFVVTPSFEDTSWAGQRFYGTDDQGQTIIERPAFAIDRLQQLRMVGLLANVAAGGDADLRALSYEPLFFNFEADREAALASETFTTVTAIADEKTGGKTLPVVFPDADEMMTYDTLLFEVVQNCDDNNDANCPEWDKRANLYVCSEPEGQPLRQHTMPSRRRK